MDGNDESRRQFLHGVSISVPAAVLLGGGKALAARGGEGRSVIGGSPSPAFSRAIVFGGLAFVSGVVGQESGESAGISNDFETQCRQAMKNLQASVEAAGSSLANVLKCTGFLTDVGDFPVYNKVFRGFFPNDPPARSTVVVKELVVPGAKLEIDCVAALIDR